MITIQIDEITNKVLVFTPTDQGISQEELVPGEFDSARKLLSDDLYAELEELWTPEVIQRHKDSFAPEPIEAAPDIPYDYKPAPTMSDIQNQITQIQLAIIDLGSQDSAIHASLVDKGEILLSDVPKMIRSEVQSTLSAKNLFNA